LWRVRGEHTPAWVARSRVAGFRVLGLEPADEPDRLRALLGAVERHGQAMMASRLALRSLLSIPQPQRECRAMAAAIDCVKSGSSSARGSAYRSTPRAVGPGAIALRRLEVPGLSAVAHCSRRCPAPPPTTTQLDVPHWRRMSSFGSIEAAYINRTVGSSLFGPQGRRGLAPGAGFPVRRADHPGQPVIRCHERLRRDPRDPNVVVGVSLSSSARTTRTTGGATRSTSRTGQGEPSTPRASPTATAGTTAPSSCRSAL
jgi:hypothetical protein